MKPHTANPALEEAQRQLWEEYARTRSQRIRGILESQYLHLVESLAHQLARKLPDCVDVNDLAQEGFMGLRRAVERFNLSRAVKFSTYAQSAIWGAMMDSLRRDDFGSRATRRLATAVQAARGMLAGELGRPPSNAELAAALGLPEEKITAINQWSEATTLATMTPSAEDRRLQIEDPRAADPALEAQRRDLRELILRGFDPTERLLIILYYFEELTMREIGETLGISESRVSQMHTLLVRRIRADLERKQWAHQLTTHR
jgi:RNA polymerase sigma factor for flagellar operon FliA